MKRLIVFAGAFFAVAGLAFGADLFGRGKYESPAYEVVKSDGKFEVRKYAEMVVASTKMTSSNSGFRTLFNYISGKNEKQQKISMTTPVFTTPDGEGEKSGVMSFVVPADVAKAGAPEGTDKSVKISKREAGKFAVFRYSGRWSEAREAVAKKKLEVWMKAEGLKAKGKFEKANYDPPFTPGFLRRNEVLVRIAG